MCSTYGMVNLISSFGFCSRWRRQCLAQVQIHEGDTVFDLMSGMGELWPGIARQIGRAGRISAVDFSSAMCERSGKTAERLAGISIEVHQEDILQNSIADNSADVVVSSFGLKTFTVEQQAQLAHEVCRILRPGGTFSFLEISAPPYAWLRWPYLFYLHYIVPFIGRIFLGNPDNYRMLGRYTTAHRNCSEFAKRCSSAGLQVNQASFFFGCATGVTGKKPE